MNENETLLFQPRKGVEYTRRDSVPLLQVVYSVYQTTTACLVDNWLKGEVGSGAPTDTRERQYVDEVNTAVNGENTCSVVNGHPVGLDQHSFIVYEEMVKIHVPGHLRNVTSHRKWVRRSHEFLVRIGAKFSEKMEGFLWRHDLSKYTHREVLGYAVMFGDGAVDWRQLQTESEKEEWANTLHNHYAGNPHHPEYFYPQLEDGSRDKSVPMLLLDSENGKDFVDESIIDMLASRGERNLAKDPEFDVKKWMDIDEKYLARYSELDKKYVRESLDRFKEMAEQFLTDKTNVEAVKGFFDHRDVVYSKTK